MQPNQKVEKVCACGQQFTDTIWLRADGSEIKSFDICPACREVEKKRKEEEDLKVELTKAIDYQRDIWNEEVNAPFSFALKTFADYESKLQPKAYEAIRKLRWDWGEADEDSPKSLILLSPGLYGVGKTHLVCALINQIIETGELAFIHKDKFSQYVKKRQCPAHFTSENELLRRIRATYNRKDDGESEEDIYTKLGKYKLLIIDDVGKIRPRDLNFTQGVYFNIIDQRYTDSQAIILTTNLDLNELEAHIGGACADRLLEMAGKSNFIVMGGKSYRARS